jgi:hypothetical protein
MLGRGRQQHHPTSRPKTQQVGALLLGASPASSPIVKLLVHLASPQVRRKQARCYVPLVASEESLRRCPNTLNMLLAPPALCTDLLDCIQQANCNHSSAGAHPHDERRCSILHGSKQSRAEGRSSSSEARTKSCPQIARGHRDRAPREGGGIRCSALDFHGRQLHPQRAAPQTERHPQAEHVAGVHVLRPISEIGEACVACDESSETRRRKAFQSSRLGSSLTCAHN